MTLFPSFQNMCTWRREVGIFGRVARFNGVKVFIRAVSPAVQNAQHDGTGSFVFLIHERSPL